MDLFLAISTGIGLALATGVRPFPAALVAGLLARADLGLDFDATDFDFLESIPFLAVMLVLTAAATAMPFLSIRVSPVAFGAAAVVLGALAFGGSLADEGYAGGPGLAAGAACALLGYAAATTFLGRAEARLAGRGDTGSASLLGVYGDAASLVVAVLAIVAPPLSYLALAFCAWTLLERRRRAARKYEGLRVLR